MNQLRSSARPGLLLALLSIAGCGGSSGPADIAVTHDLGLPGNNDLQTQSLYVKYGGAPTVMKIVDDAVTGLLADCEEAPYFSVVGTMGHDSVARLKSCLRLQFTVALGGPGTYPGVNDNGDTCVSMTAIHANLGIPGPVFDRFITDLSAVLTADGVSPTDLAAIAPTIIGLKAQVVSANPVPMNACPDGGAGDGGK